MRTRTFWPAYCPINSFYWIHLSSHYLKGILFGIPIYIWAYFWIPYCVYSFFKNLLITIASWYILISERLFSNITTTFQSFPKHFACFYSTWISDSFYLKQNCNSKNSTTYRHFDQDYKELASNHSLKHSICAFKHTEKNRSIKVIIPKL